jgi:hypothetical protein
MHQQVKSTVADTWSTSQIPISALTHLNDSSEISPSARLPKTDPLSTPMPFVCSPREDDWELLQLLSEILKGRVSLEEGYAQGELGG